MQRTRLEFAAQSRAESCVRRALIDHAILERAEQVAKTPRLRHVAAKPVPAPTAG